MRKAHELVSLCGGKVLVMIEDHSGKNSYTYTSDDQWWEDLIDGKLKLSAYNKVAQRVNSDYQELEEIKKIGNETKRFVIKTVPEVPTPKKRQNAASEADFNFIADRTETGIE